VASCHTDADPPEREALLSPDDNFRNHWRWLPTMRPVSVYLMSARQARGRLSSGITWMSGADHGPPRGRCCGGPAAPLRR